MFFALPIALFAAAVSAQPFWPGTCGGSSRSSQSPLPLMVKAPSMGASFPSFGKSHGSPAVASNNDVFWFAWNSTGPFLYAWRAESGELEAAPLLDQDGSDVMSDSFDPLLLSDSGLLFVSYSSYGSSDSPAFQALFDVSNPLGSGPLWCQSTESGATVSAAAFVSLDAQEVLVTVVPGKRELQIRDAQTGKVIRSTLLYTGACDWRASLTVDLGNATTAARAWILCPDDTFKKPTVYGVDLTTGNIQFSVTVPGLASYWPAPLSYWRSADLVLGVTQAAIWLVNPANGSVVLKVRTPPVYVNTLLAYAHGSAALPGSDSPSPVLYLLGQTANNGGTSSTYLLAYNTTGQLLAQPTLVPLRMDQFQGSPMLWPDGLTLTVNGWDSASPAGGAPATLATLRLDPVAGRINTLWYGPSWPGSQGRTTMFAAPRTNGSIVLAGWDGVYQYN